MITLREDQERAVTDMRAALVEHDSILFRGPTGCGKTVIASYIAQQVTARRKRVVFCVHRTELALQTASTFDQFGIKYGFISAGRPSNPFALAQIASADTLRNRPHLLKNTSLFVPDEAHLFASLTRRALIQSAKDAGAKIVGLSATPERLDGKPLDMFDALVDGPSEAWLIEQGHLSRYRAFAPVQPDMSGLHSRAGDYVVGELEDRFDKPSITGDAVEVWKKYAAGKRTIVFAISRKHGQHVADAYNAAGVGAVYIDGETPHHERKSRIQDFANGKAMILVNIALCVEGFDLSAQVGRDVPIEAVQLLNPTQSLARARQMMGRALRKKPEPAIILDHVRMLETHGLPDDERVWSLDGRSTKKQAGVADLATSTCMDCFSAFKSSLRACPFCSSERTTGEGRRVEVEAGDLEELNLAAIKAAKRREVGRTDTVAGLADIAVERSYKTGWLITKAKTKGINRNLTWGDACRAMFDAKQRRERVAA